ncbi:MAG: glycosyltransferase family 4 protein [Actinomycetota bacterium]
MHRPPPARRGCENPAVPDNLRIALTVEQCWHRVPGGTAVAAIGMARALMGRAGVTVLGVAARHRSTPAEGWTPPLPVRHLSLPRLALYESWHRLRRPNVEGATGPVDVVHATSIAMPPRSAPIVLTIHDLAFVAHPEHFTRRGLSFFRRGLALALRDADLVLCSSRATARACERAGFHPTRLRHVPLGVDVAPAADREVQRVRRSYGLDRPYLLWTGTIEPRKNLGGLLRALPHVDADVELVVAGPRGWNEDLDALVAGARRTVRVLGFVPAADLGGLYAGASAFCWPSLMEGFGFPVLEAMAQGTPVVTSRGTSTEELAAGAGVLVDPHDPGAIAEGINEVLNDGPRAAQLAEAGRTRAAGYSWSRCGDLVLEAYRDAARGVA